MKKASIFIILTGLSLNAQVPLNGLIAGWPFTGNASDMSGNSNHGTVFNASLTTDRFGNSNHAYYFSGANANIVTQKPGPLGTSARSVSFWGQTSSSSLMCAWGYGDESGGGSFALEFNYCTPGLGLDNGHAAFMQSAPAVSDGQWHHYVTVFEPSTGSSLADVKLYVDGSLLTSTTCAISNVNATVFTNNLNPFTIGNVPDNPIRYWNGKLDDFYMYDRALSATEISQLYSVEGTATDIQHLHSSTLDIYPVPASDLIQIADAGGQITYSVTNLFGQKVSEGQSSDGSIKVSELPQGTYLLIITRETGDQRGRFVVE